MISVIEPTRSRPSSMAWRIIFGHDPGQCAIIFHDGRLPKFRWVIMWAIVEASVRDVAVTASCINWPTVKVFGSQAFMKNSVCLIRSSLFSFLAGREIGSQDITSCDDADQFILRVHHGDPDQIACAQHVYQRPQRRFRPD